MFENFPFNVEVGIKALGSAKNIQELLTIASGAVKAPYTGYWMSYRRVRVFMALIRMQGGGSRLARWAAVEAVKGHSIQVAEEPIGNSTLLYPYQFTGTGRWSASDSGGDWKILLDATLEALAERQEHERHHTEEWTQKMASIQYLWELLTTPQAVGNLEEYLRWRILHPRHEKLASGVLDRKYATFFEWGEPRIDPQYNGSNRISLLDLHGAGKEERSYEWEEYLPPIEEGYDCYKTVVVAKAIAEWEQENLSALCKQAGIPDRQ